MQHNKNVKYNLLFDIDGYEGLYSIDNQGKVYSWKSQKYLKPIKQNTGYHTVSLHKDKKIKIHFIHRLVAQTFLENPLHKKQVNHKDLNKTNNSVFNLEWVTCGENIKHSIENGQRLGEKNGNSKLTPNQIIEIREKYKFRKCTYKNLAKEYGVRENYIGRIVNKAVWKHV